MRLNATADLHYDFAEHRPAVEALAEEMCGQGAHVLAIAGDIFALDIECLERCLKLFDGFRGEKVLVAGNHDVWTHGRDSFELYDRVIPDVAAACGFHDLDTGPKVVGDVGLVGTMGWYDYSFRDESLDIPLRFYEHKAAPGYAFRHDAFQHLFDPADDVPIEALRARSYWNDGKMVHWRFDDPGFTKLTVDRLEAQLAEVEPQVRSIVAITHHVPFTEMLRRKKDPSWAFGNAFMGSVALGETLLRHEKVSHVLFGHSHTRERRRIGHVEAINIGCTYQKKRYDTIDV